ncbi:F0F1 ATP synthase subunit delta, partial [Prevotella sp.]
MQFIANSFVTLYRKHNNLISAKLTTACPIDSNTEKKMRQLVEGRTNGTVEFQTEVNPNIIGGFVLEYDTYRMDASVKRQLNTILSQLN